MGWQVVAALEPQAEITCNGYWYTVYGWDRWMMDEIGRAHPMRECLGLYDWHVSARIRRWWWLRHTRAESVGK